MKEGFQHDNSYFQHGVQLYIGGYGDEILKGVNTGSSLHQRNEICIDDERIQLLGHFMRGTHYQVIRGQYMLFDVFGKRSEP